MKKVDRWAALTAALLLTVSLAPASQAAEAGEKIVILHTIDDHCALDDAIGYAGLAAYAGALEEQYGADRVTLVDAGDAIQGQAVGTLSQGEYLSLIHIWLMVPGSTFRYGSSFWTFTRRPRCFSRRPREAAVMPLPRPETTPPVTKMYFTAMLIPPSKFRCV